MNKRLKGLVMAVILLGVLFMSAPSQSASAERSIDDETEFFQEEMKVLEIKKIVDKMSVKEIGRYKALVEVEGEPSETDSLAILLMDERETLIREWATIFVVVCIALIVIGIAISASKSRLDRLEKSLEEGEEENE